MIYFKLFIAALLSFFLSLFLSFFIIIKNTKYLSKLYHQQSLYYQDSDEEEPILVTQNLDQDQYDYEFPPKSYLEALSYLDEGDNKYSFFDPSSFTVTALLSVDQDHMSWHETTIVDDGRLSPLQLPAQRPRELSCESASTVKQLPVRPSFFLANQVTQARSNSGSICLFVYII